MLGPDTIGELSAGDVIANKYVVDARIGEGGFAHVYRVHHENLSAMEFALKVLRVEHASDVEVRRRFRREAEAVVALKSRHVVRVLDVGELADGRPFLVMELMAGRPLDAVLRDMTVLPWELVAEIAIGVLRALDEAHRVGIIHRDLKPENIFLEYDEDGLPVAKVVDFGIAKGLAGTASGFSSGTQTIVGQVVCTPAYAAPELLEGNVGPEVDLYALGHTMAALLDGSAPYDGASSAMAIAARHLHPEPVVLGPNASASPLAGVIRRACEKPLTARYASAAQMVTEVRALFAHRQSGSLSASPSTRALPTTKPSESAPLPDTASSGRDRTGWTVAAVSVVGLVVAVWVLYVGEKTEVGAGLVPQPSLSVETPTSEVPATLPVATPPAATAEDVVPSAEAGLPTDNNNATVVAAPAPTAIEPTALPPTTVETEQVEPPAGVVAPAVSRNQGVPPVASERQRSVRVPATAPRLEEVAQPVPAEARPSSPPPQASPSVPPAHTPRPRPVAPVAEPLVDDPFGNLRLLE